MKEKKSKEKNEIMSNTKKQILKTSIIDALILVCFIGIYIAFSLFQDAMFSRIWQVVTMILLAISIAIFEIAYKKDSGLIAISGIEVLVLSCYTLTLEYIKIRFSIDVKLYIITCGIVFLVYYLLKTMIIYTSGRKKELNSLSDISEIVKEDSPKKKQAIKHKKGEE